MAWAEGAAFPGTRETGSKGCTCAVLDNNHGQRPPYQPSGWWITQGCPQHDVQPEEVGA